ncbi:hypothetical protein G5C51_16430 [Streptomyces sp. A7024]|uniref:Uncharacterized protein n=1 Tax=Streptomyces coryli TaxID=1128680 RepID=A0A6G4U2G5_9ACTN|nr:hypothetical protein [Streptomyces coryli]NGN65477.1 hypothetical protein [Streptomyces coryli]
MPAQSPSLPPVQLPDEAELARAALSAPLFAHAVVLARWSGPQTRVGAGGELLDDDLRAAAKQLGLGESEEDLAHADDAWRIAVDTGLVEVEQTDESAEGDEDADSAGTVTHGEELALVGKGSPQDILGLWLTACESVLSDAAAPDLSGLVEQLGEDGELDLDELDWDPDADADFLDGVLANLYFLTAMEDGDGAVPLPALAASMVVPEDMDEPTDEVLQEVSEAMMRLDDQFRLLEQTGMVAYRPVDEALIAAVDDNGPAEVASDEDEDVSRYGVVRLTPLGVYGLRERMIDDGVDAPLVGDLADKGADALLEALPEYADAAARSEATLWLADRDEAEAARDLLAAARGDDGRGPRRRLAAQQTLSMLGPAAEPALREVLDDHHLGGLARVWLTERGAADVPAPAEDTVYWLTVDTIAAQLGGPYDDSAELRDLVEGLVGQNAGFFDTIWRTDHPSTPEVLEAMGRLHPDRQVAKEARKAAFKARSR